MAILAEFRAANQALRRVLPAWGYSQTRSKLNYKLIGTLILNSERK